MPCTPNDTPVCRDIRVHTTSGRAAGAAGAQRRSAQRRRSATIRAIRLRRRCRWHFELPTARKGRRGTETCRSAAKRSDEAEERCAAHFEFSRCASADTTLNFARMTLQNSTAIVSRTARYPAWHGIPHGTVSHAAQYPAQHNRTTQPSRRRIAAHSPARTRRWIGQRLPARCCRRRIPRNKRPICRTAQGVRVCDFGRALALGDVVGHVHLRRRALPSARTCGGFAHVRPVCACERGGGGGQSFQFRCRLG